MQWCTVLKLVLCIDKDIFILEPLPCFVSVCNLTFVKHKNVLVVTLTCTVAFIFLICLYVFTIGFMQSIYTSVNWGYGSIFKPFSNVFVTLAYSDMKLKLEFVINFEMQTVNSYM